MTPGAGQGVLGVGRQALNTVTAPTVLDALALNDVTANLFAICLTSPLWENRNVNPAGVMIVGSTGPAHLWQQHLQWSTLMPTQNLYALTIVDILINERSILAENNVTAQDLNTNGGAILDSAAENIGYYFNILFMALTATFFFFSTENIPFFLHGKIAYFFFSRGFF